MSHADPSPERGRPEAEPSEAPGAGASGEEAPWLRLHPLSPLLRGGLVAIVVAGIVIANLRDRLIGLFFGQQFASAEPEPAGDFIDMVVEQGFVVLALVGVLVVILLIVFFAWLSWRFHTYRISGEAVESRSGVLFRQHRRAPLDRIQSVNLQRPLLARALGLTQVEVQTGGQGGKVVLAYLGYRDAKTVREQILRRAAVSQGAVSRSATSGTSQVQDPAAGDLGLVAAAPRVPGAPGDGAPRSERLQDLDRRLEDFSDADVDAEATAAGMLVTVPPGRLIGSVVLSWEFSIFVLLSVASVVAGVLVEPFFLTLLIPFALAAIGIGFRGFNRGWGFTLSRGADSVRVGAGLTATNTETLPLGRIHAVEARQPLFWRPFGWWQVRVTTAGHSAAQGGQGSVANLVLPVGFESDVLRVIETLLPNSIVAEAGEAELRDALSGNGAGFVGAGPRAGWVLWFARRRTGLRLVGEGQVSALRIRRGAMTRALSIVPIVRVQSLLFRRPLVHLPLGLATLQTHTVLGPAHTEVRGIALADAQELFDRLSATIVAVQGAEAHGSEMRGFGAHDSGRRQGAHGS